MKEICIQIIILITQNTAEDGEEIRGKRSLQGLGRRVGFGYMKDAQSGRACICRVLLWGGLRARGWGVGEGDTIFGTRNDSYRGWVMGSQQIFSGGEDSTRVVLYEVELAED